VTSKLRGVAVLLVAGGCHRADRAPPPAREVVFTYTAHALPLPAGSGSAGVGMDLIAYDAHSNAVWVPAGNTGAVDVLDVASGKLSQVSGFATAEIERDGKQRTVGPSAAAVGDKVVYVGDRADSSVCAIDEATLVKTTCATLDGRPDGIAYVAKTHEVWVTLPRDKAILVLDAATLDAKFRLSLEGVPEGVAVDGTRSRFYTNYEDKDATLAIDLDSHAIVATWQPHCGEDGPHGLALDEPAGQLFVACTTKVETIDVAKGAIIGSLDVGEGVDDFDYAPATHMLYVAAAKAATLTVATVAPSGALSLRATVPTKPGARNAVVDARGTVYVPHSRGGELLVLSPAST
jgi:DNA-binding beta-propeller fold protein YncE